MKKNLKCLILATAASVASGLGAGVASADGQMYLDFGAATGLTLGAESKFVDISKEYDVTYGWPVILGGGVGYALSLGDSPVSIGAGVEGLFCTNSGAKMKEHGKSDSAETAMYDLSKWGGYGVIQAGVAVGDMLTMSVLGGVGYAQEEVTIKATTGDKAQNALPNMSFEKTTGFDWMAGAGIGLKPMGDSVEFTLGVRVIPSAKGEAKYGASKLPELTDQKQKAAAESAAKALPSYYVLGRIGVRVSLGV